MRISNKISAAVIQVDQITIKVDGLSQAASQQLGEHIANDLQSGLSDFSGMKSNKGRTIPSLEVKIQATDGVPLRALSNQIVSKLVAELSQSIRLRRYR